MFNGFLENEAPDNEATHACEICTSACAPLRSARVRAYDDRALCRDRHNILQKELSAANV